MVLLTFKTGDSKLRFIQKASKIVTAVFIFSFFIYAPISSTQTLVATPVVKASNVDIIVEANTYIPYFYGGRAEPTAGNSIRLVALTEEVGEQSLTYRWKLGNIYTVTNNPVLETKLSQIEEVVLIEVTVINSNNIVIGKGSEFVSVSEPKILFYEDNPLRGTSRVAVQDNLILIGSETTIKAEPYFIGTESVETLNANWSGNLTMEQTEGDWRFIYLKSNDEAGAAKGKMMLKVANPLNLNEYLSATLNVSL